MPNLIRTVLPLAAAIRAGYRRMFSVGEIERSRMLQWLYGAMLFAFYVTYNHWIEQPWVSVETAAHGGALCWPYFTQCGSLFFLHAIPFGYSQTIFYAAVYGIMALAAYCMWRNAWTAAHFIMLGLWIWKGLNLFLFTSAIQGGPNYHHFFLVAALLFPPNKEYFSRLAFILLYFAAAVVKLDDTWILGSYFTSLQAGLPIFGNALAPLFTNFVILMQIAGSWFLMSAYRWRQRIALAVFAVFHVYAGVIVGYTYPALALSSLLILFGPLYVPERLPLSKKALFGWALIAVLIFFHAPRHFIEGDSRYTQEGSHLGLNLFDANHQCVIEFATYSRTAAPIASATWHARPGSSCGNYVCLVATSDSMENGLAVHTERWESPVAWKRCNPYTYWLPKKNAQCSKPSTVRVSMRLDHSIDGGPFYRVVDEPNICTLSYQPFGHNDWIHSPPDAAIDGYPVKNVYRFTTQAEPSPYNLTPASTSAPNLLVLNELVGNEPVTETPLQQALAPYAATLRKAWIVMWFAAIGLVIVSVIRDIKRR